MNMARVQKKTTIVHEYDSSLRVECDDGYLEIMYDDWPCIEGLTLRGAIAMRDAMEAAIKEIEGHIRYAQFQRARSGA